MSFTDSLRAFAETAARRVVGSGGLLERTDEAIDHALSPRYHARPPIIEAGEHDGGIPAFRFICPNCGARVAPDAIDWGDGVRIPPMPRYCPECCCALGDLPVQDAASLVEGKEVDATW